MVRLPSHVVADAGADVLRADPRRAGVFTDFDGTLAPIVDDPAAARPLSGAPDVLEALAMTYAVVGVISGRPAAFLAAHLGGRGLRLSGLYGMQTVAADGTVVEPEQVTRWRAVVDDVARRAELAAPAGTRVERKGASVTLHYREDPGAEAALRDWAAAATARTGLELMVARKSFELRPPVGVDKGTALEAGAAGLAAACFVGDDLGDLACFDALDRLAARGVAGVRVAVRSDESPPLLLERADIVVEGPEGALSWLRRLR
jgi:trehalose 6-phosphate phosphatase